MSSWRGLIKKLAKSIDNIGRRVGSDEMLSMCQAISPSRTSVPFFCCCCVTCFLISPCSVRTGGRAFEHYLEMMATYTTHKFIKSFARQQPQYGPILKMNAADEATIVKREKGGFMGCVLHTIANIGSNAIGQTFYLAFSARFHGLSRTGQNLIAQYGFMMKTTSYDKAEKDIIKQALHHIRSVKFNSHLTLLILINPF
jgi:hypothetical protein